MRTTIAILSLTAALFGHAQTPEVLERGIASYRAGDYERAAAELKEATQIFLAPEQMKKYVNTGEFENLAELETALVYLALAQTKLGRTEEARESVLRLMSAERIKPTFAALSLPAETAEFTRIATSLVPDANLNQVQVATATPPPLTPAPVVAPMPEPRPPQPQPVQIVQTPAPPPPTVVLTPVPVQPQQAQPNVEQLLADERARMERDLERRIAEIRAAAQRSAEERIAAERASIQQGYIPRDYFRALRDADNLAVDGQFREANDIYNSLVVREGVPREVVIEAAIGLYRTGAFRGAAEAFRKLAPFRRGEEDVRYYNAVVLYETGAYDAAGHELSCALPFIHVTEDVARYRQKIEQMAQRQALR